MNKIKNINKNYIIAAVLSNHFFITKYLLYNLYTHGTIYSFMYLFIICLIIAGLSPILYHYTKKNFLNKRSPIVAWILSVYLLISSILSLITLGNFVSIHWLNATNQTLIIGSILLLIVFIAFVDDKAVYKTLALLFLVLLAILLIYGISKYQFLSIEHITTYISLSKMNFDVIIYSVFIILETFFIFFIPNVDKAPLTKKNYYTYIGFMIFVILFEGIIELNEFNGIIQYVTYPFFESFNIIYFGQYIGYLNFPVLFIYVIGCFSKIALNLKVLQKNLGKSKWNGIFIALCFIIPVALLKNANDYANIRLFFVIPALIALFLALLLYNLKGGLLNGRNTNSTRPLPKKRRRQVQGQ
ncbi:MAG: hypothetical protein ACLROI_04920 [Beduini sp.]|uniref:hypothetical protein n=1 Tax=Beduini sp. TaxID=1922300 RepID=UPI0011CA8D8B